ncbi:MAG: hypothetical protein ABS81_14105 [Pseudonocardia sp. SCN 72-86]|nr:MAG: hypothetical protein ABS81_14105 [Pseudonocardia sp. SCN 72-86]
MSSDEHGPRTDDAASTVVVPIGSQVLGVPASVTRHLLELPEGAATRLTGTRVWFQRRGGELVVHVGDVEPDGDLEQD